jgi:putative tryptophan/tyrosine transport system substrate-binding protein
MRRREFIAGLGSVAAWPLAARAQQSKPASRVGVLAVESTRGEAFLQGLRDLGYVEGRNLVIEFRDAGGRMERLAALAEDLARINVDLIFAQGSQATRAARQATTTIPIVMISSDPIGLGFVASLSRPGGNITGLSLLAPEVSGKRLELLKQIIPGIVLAAVLWNPDDPGAVVSLKETQSAAQTLGLKLQTLEARSVDAFDNAFQAAIREGAGAVVLLPAPVMGRNADRIAALGLRSRLPTVFFEGVLPKAGGLISYGVSLSAVDRRAAYYADRILKGAKPAELPVEQPTKFDLVINLKTAKALGLTIPETLLATADELIE